MPAKQLKDDEMVRQAVISIVRSKGYSITDSDMNSMTQNKETGSYTIKTSNGIQEIPAKDLMKTVDDALVNSKEWQASLEQDAKAESYKVHKNLSEEQAKQEIDNPTLGYAKRAQDIFLKGGVTAKQALEIAGSEKIKMDKISNLKTYASGAASRELSESKMTGTIEKDGTGTGGAGKKGGSESDENAALRTSLTSQSNVGAASSTLLQTNIKDYEAKEGAVLAKMKETNNQYSAAEDIGNNDIMQNAETEKTVLQEELDQIRRDKSKAQERFNRVLTRKTAEVYPGHSWSTIKNKANEEVAKALKTDPAFSKLTDEQLKAIANTEYTLETESASAGGFVAKTFKFNYTSVNGPVSIKLSDNTVDQIQRANRFKDNILKAAQNDAKLIDQVQTTGISFNAGASKALEGIVGSSALYDASNTTNVTKDLIGKIDPTKISIGQLHPEIDRVSVNIDGTNYLMDISNARTKKYMADKLLNSPEKDMRTIGRDLLLDVNYKASTKYEDAFGKGSGVVTKHPLDPKSSIIIEGVEYGVKRVSNSKTGTENYVFIHKDKVTAIPLGDGTTKTTFTFPEIKTILNNMVQPVQ
jgi:hypothetical protein